jgi:hypothetical protein
LFAFLKNEHKYSDRLELKILASRIITFILNMSLEEFTKLVDMINDKAELNEIMGDASNIMGGNTYTVDSVNAAKTKKNEEEEEEEKKEEKKEEEEEKEENKKPRPLIRFDGSTIILDPKNSDVTWQWKNKGDEFWMSVAPETIIDDGVVQVIDKQTLKVSNILDITREIKTRVRQTRREPFKLTTGAEYEENLAQARKDIVAEIQVQTEEIPVSDVGYSFDTVKKNMKKRIIGNPLLANHVSQVFYDRVTQLIVEGRTTDEKILDADILRVFPTIMLQPDLMAKKVLEIRKGFKIGELTPEQIKQAEEAAALRREEQRVRTEQRKKERVERLEKQRLEAEQRKVAEAARLEEQRKLKAEQQKLKAAQDLKLQEEEAARLEEQRKLKAEQQKLKAAQDLELQEEEDKRALQDQLKAEEQKVEEAAREAARDLKLQEEEGKVNEANKQTAEKSAIETATKLDAANTIDLIEWNVDNNLLYRLDFDADKVYGDSALKLMRKANFIFQSDQNIKKAKWDEVRPVIEKLFPLCELNDLTDEQLNSTGNPGQAPSKIVQRILTAMLYVNGDTDYAEDTDDDTDTESETEDQNVGILESFKSYWFGGSTSLDTVEEQKDFITQDYFGTLKYLGIVDGRNETLLMKFQNTDKTYRYFNQNLQKYIFKEIPEMKNTQEIKDKLKSKTLKAGDFVVTKQNNFYEIRIDEKDQLSYTIYETDKGKKRIGQEYVRKKGWIEPVSARKRHRAALDKLKPGAKAESSRNNNIMAESKYPAPIPAGELSAMLAELSSMENTSDSEYASETSEYEEFASEEFASDSEEFAPDEF